MRQCSVDCVMKCLDSLPLLTLSVGRYYACKCSQIYCIDIVFQLLDLQFWQMNIKIVLEQSNILEVLFTCSYI